MRRAEDCPPDSPRYLIKMRYDVFISHASEDKEAFVRPLAEQLDQSGLRVWYDEFTLIPGDSLSSQIDEGLNQSRYGIVVVSPSFIKKEWPKREYRGLISKLLAGENRIIPIWHGVSSDEVRHFSPPLADTVGMNSEEGVHCIAERLLKLIPVAETSPASLLAEAEELVSHGHYASAIMTAAVALQDVLRGQARQTLAESHFKKMKLERYSLRRLFQLMTRTNSISLLDDKGGVIDWRWLVNLRNQAVHDVKGKRITRQSAMKYVSRVRTIEAHNRG